jgi:uncharacterized membrane protein
MIGLTPLGAFHTVVALVALICGLVALGRSLEISSKTRLGQVYLVTTLVTAVTALGIFHHGGFGPPHVLAVLTLVALAVGTVAGRSALFGRASRYVEAVSYSSTILFHMIAGVTESSTRLPAGAPLIASPDAPLLEGIQLALLAAFLVGVTFQVRRLRAQAPPGHSRAIATRDRSL